MKELDNKLLLDLAIKAKEFYEASGCAMTITPHNERFVKYRERFGKALEAAGFPPQSHCIDGHSLEDYTFLFIRHVGDILREEDEEEDDDDEYNRELGSNGG